MSKKYSTERPDWVPEDADCKFTTSVMGGIEGIKDLTVGNINPNLLNGKGMPHRKLVLSEDDYVAGVERGDRMTLSRAITLIESNSSRLSNSRSVCCSVSCRRRATLCASDSPVFRGRASPR